MNSWQQPTTGEPACGTPHWHGLTAGTTPLFARAATSAYFWYTVTFAGVPRGSGMVSANVETALAGAGAMDVHIRKYGDATTAGPQNKIMATSGGTFNHDTIEFPLSSTKGTQVTVNSTLITLSIWDAIQYSL